MFKLFRQQKKKTENQTNPKGEIREMKLYYIPMACSMAVHVALRKAGVSPELVKYDPSTGKTGAGENFAELFPKSYVPVLIDGSGEVLTEVAAILLELDARYPEANLLPTSGPERRRAIEWLCYISAELHKKFLVPLFSDNAPTEADRQQRELIAKSLAFMDTHALRSREYLFGDDMSAVDIYFLVMLLWTAPAKVDLTPFPRLVEYRDRALKEAPVLAAMSAEGLL